MSMTVSQRKKHILEQILARGHVAVRDLALDLSVSEATVRRDLRQLADAKQIDLVYGGATVRRSPDQSLQSRARQNIEAKRAIGKLASELVQDGDMIFVDCGTTCFEMRHYLKAKRALTVILNSTRLAMELGENSDFSIILLGGNYRHDRMDAIGPLAVNAIDQLRGYTAFIGVDGLDMDFGLSASDIQTAHLYQHVMKNARESILLADRSKFLSPSLYRIGDIESVSRIVTDGPPPAEWIGHLAALGIDLIYPDSKEKPHA